MICLLSLHCGKFNFLFKIEELLPDLFCLIEVLIIKPELRVALAHPERKLLRIEVIKCMSELFAFIFVQMAGCQDQHF